MSASAAESVLVFLAGDVMTGRGIDQILAHPSKPELREPAIDDATAYVELAERAHGAVPTPVGPEYPWGEALEVLADMQPELAIVNLETSITTSDEFGPSKAVHYRMHPGNIACLKAAHIDICTLANNHVLDFGIPGLIETLATLHAAGIASAGAGRDRSAASRPARWRAGAAMVAVFGFGATSSGIPLEWAAGPDRPGVRVLDDLSLASADEVVEHIRSNTGSGELAIASIHWGSNWGHEVGPEAVAFAHRLIEGGVALVHGHSSHHLRAIEIHRGKLILYGCGDLVTDYEGIQGYEAWRGDLGAMIFVDLSLRDGSVNDLYLVPMTMKRLRLVRAGASDVRWLEATLNRLGRPFDTRFARRDAGSIVLSAGKS